MASCLSLLQLESTMKTRQVTIVKWPFDRLFPKNQFVWGDFQNESGKPTEVCIGEIELIKPIYDRGAEERGLWLSVSESIWGPRNMKGTHLSLTLRKAKNIDARPDGSITNSVLLNRGELATDGAMRIGREFFKLINLRTKPVSNNSNLLNHFIVFEHTVVGAGLNPIPIEEYLRRKNGLPSSAINARRLDAHLSMFEAGLQTTMATWSRNWKK
jgi:hypothetical protein